MVASKQQYFLVVIVPTGVGCTTLRYQNLNRQNQKLTSGLPSKNNPGPVLLNLRVQMGAGVSYKTLPFKDIYITQEPGTKT